MLSNVCGQYTVNSGRALLLLIISTCNNIPPPNNPIEAGEVRAQEVPGTTVSVETGGGQSFAFTFIHQGRGAYLPYTVHT
jgi:hypothetical protein